MSISTQTSDELAQSIRNQFPLIFGDRDLVSSADFYEAYNAVAEYTVKSSEPALKSESHKQQWSLAGASIGLIALILFKVGELKIGDVKVAVDSKVLVWYAVFLSILLATFLLRASLDLKRAALARNKDSNKLDLLKDLVQTAFVKRNLQQFFWLELFHQIGLRYETYSKAQVTDPNDAPHERIDMRILKMDIAGLKKLEEFSAEIVSHEEFVEDMVRQLDSDAQRFLNRVLEYDNPVMSKSTLQESGSWGRFSSVTQYFDTYLKAWLDARDALSSVSLDVSLDKRAMRETVMLDAQLALLRKARNITRLYTFTEIALPTLLALSALGYVVFTLHASGA